MVRAGSSWSPRTTPRGVPRGAGEAAAQCEAETLAKRAENLYAAHAQLVGQRLHGAAPQMRFGNRAHPPPHRMLASPINELAARGLDSSLDVAAIGTPHLPVADRAPPNGRRRPPMCRAAATSDDPSAMTRCASAGSSISRSAACGQRPWSPQSTSSPFRSCSTMYGIPPARVVATGSPQANDSMIELGMLSMSDAFRYTSASSYQRPISVGCTAPMKSTWRSDSSAPARGRAHARAAPTTISRASGSRSWISANARNTHGMLYRRLEVPVRQEHGPEPSRRR